ncbi:hypothetical protein RB195_022925 [Necator americanus]|uniref:Uncharacterized protein n=1 Tax=Necator americanus TaxID=51031 RepID=A0ABR1EI13_NECAM
MGSTASNSAPESDSYKMGEEQPSFPKKIRPCCLYKYPEWVQGMAGEGKAPCASTSKIVKNSRRHSGIHSTLSNLRRWTVFSDSKAQHRNIRPTPSGFKIKVQLSNMKSSETVLTIHNVTMGP